MVSDASRPLSRIGFRRDVKLFLGILAGLLVTLIAVLLVLLQQATRRGEEATRLRFEQLADLAATAVHDAAPYAPGELVARANELRTSHGISHVMIDAYGERIESGTAHESLLRIERRRPFGTIALSFDDSALQRQRRAFLLTAIVVSTATLISCLLLFLYVPKILAPIEQLLDQAKEVEAWSHEKDEAHYLIDTFRRSIETLRVQEAELKRLHLLERTRADDLERVTTTLTRSLSSGLVALDAAGVVVETNAAAHEMLPLRDGSIAGVHIRDAIAHRELAALLDTAFIEQQSLSRHEVELDAERGHLRIGVTTVPLRNEDGEVFGMLILLTDLTPLRTLEQRVRDMQSLADLGEISAGIAHEFRNGLSTILGYLKLARRSPLPPDAAPRVEGAEREAAELSAAVERLLAFARPMKPELQPVELQSFVREIARRLAAGDDVRMLFEGEPVEINADPTLLARAIENLLRNAIESVRQKGDGSVTVTTSATRPPQLTIRDTGVGFDPANAAKLFLPFHSEKSNGIGMGLPLAKKIILIHGGTLELTGAPGEGATARIEFIHQSEPELRDAPQTVTL